MSSRGVLRTGCRPALAGLVLLAMSPVAGCATASGVNEQLLQAATEANAAVQSGSLAFRLFSDGSLTRAAAETNLVDMTRQLTSAQKSLITLELSGIEQQSRRDDTLAAVGEGTAAVLAGRDCLQAQVSCSAAEAALARAGDRLSRTVDALRGSR